MVQQVKYSYEILIEDRSGKSEITNVKSLSKALAYSERLWEDSEIRETAKESIIEDKILDITLQVEKLSSNGVFLLSVQSPNFEKIEAFRQKLLSHTIHKLGFVSAKVLADTVTEKIASSIYPVIKDVENTLRKSLTKSLVRKDGFSGLESLSKSVGGDQLKNKAANTFDGLIDTKELSLDFNNLSEVLQKTSFADSDFKSNWEALAMIREKVLAYVPLVIEDYNNTQKLSKDLLSVILKNEHKDIEVKRGEEKPRLVNTAPQMSNSDTTSAKKENSVLPEDKKPIVNLVSTEEVNLPSEPVNVQLKEEQPRSAPESNKATVTLKVADLKEDTAVLEEENIPSGYNMITEAAFLEELKIVEKAAADKFVGLKTFVTKDLARKGYATGPSYSVSKMLDEKGKVKVYDVKDSIGLIIKGIKTV